MYQRNHKSDNILYVIFGLVGFVIFSNMVMSCVVSTVYADTSTVTTVTAIVPDSCSFSSGGGTYNESLDPNTSNNVVTGNNIVTSCNDGSGYAIYAVGYSNDSYTGTNTDLIHSTNTNYNIKTDGSGNYNSSWKMKVTSVSNATIAGSFNTFQNIPSSFTKIASYTTNTTEGIITPSYQINIGNAQPAGVYTGKVKYVLVHPNTMTPASSVYTIAYNANGGSGTMSNETGLYNFDEHTLPSSGFTAPSGYTFAGWCTTNTSQYACSDGTSYAAGASVDSLASAGGTVTLYAYWTKIYIQDLTLANCPADGMTVYDKRDEKDYTVKLINGECWMTQNLRYLGDTGSAAKTMTIGNNNSNVANKSITLYSLNSSNAGSFNDYSSHCDDTNGYNYACVYDSGSTSTGVRYNYYVASAGTISDSSNSTAATSDICPAGWHLPSNTDYNKLVGNTTSEFQDPTSGLTAFSAVAGGYYYNGRLINTGYGSWWSATASNATFRYFLFYNSSNGQFSYNGYSDYRYDGHFVRCVRSS